MNNFEAGKRYLVRFSSGINPNVFSFTVTEIWHELGVATWINCKFDNYMENGHAWCRSDSFIKLAELN